MGMHAAASHVERIKRDGDYPNGHQPIVNSLSLSLLAIAGIFGVPRNEATAYLSPAS
jgi:hypothetical protein